MTKKKAPAKKVAKKKPTPKKKPIPKKTVEPKKAFMKIITVEQADGAVKVSGSVTGNKALMSHTLARLAIGDKKMEEILLTAFGLFLAIKKDSPKKSKKK
jgi:hypothetical protein